ncbi:GntR family transcriptional regulator [Paenarthrobacter sp. YJN-5]|uniref:GntR family transcriptional regulator n=1 Tax=Paenarthrobacter sp. YJN-5 TaxID=2735316 RepID=UPI001878CBDC|nr:GntR family transcriptional regulator [Paenarthrobacter sp. YJN-5]QOT19819.1 GntR family transcriptional regulator [Paenarthrobacter sp. YJN-5]
MPSALLGSLGGQQLPDDELLELWKPLRADETMANRQRQDTSKPVADQIYTTLRDMIIGGLLEPGMRIRQRELATKLNVSRIPLREALPRLEAEGLITTTPRRGAVVAQLTEQDARELFEVRAALDAMAARLAAAKCATEQTAQNLEDALEKTEEATDAGDVDRIAAAHMNLHEQILALADSTLLAKLTAQIAGRVKLVSLDTGIADPKQLHYEHISICNAIRRGQVELAGALLSAHDPRCRTNS